MASERKLQVQSLVDGSVVDVPDFMAEAEKADFWDSHDLTDESWDRMKDISDGPPPEWNMRQRGEHDAELTLPVEAVAELRKIAEQRHQSWQPMVVTWIQERIKQERAARRAS